MKRRGAEDFNMVLVAAKAGDADKAKAFVKDHQFSKIHNLRPPIFIPFHFFDYKF